MAAPAQSVSEGSLDVVQTGDTPEFGFAGGSVVVAPIPFSNPTLGSGLALGGAWLFTADPQSRTSSIGVGGFKSDNGSSGYAVFAGAGLVGEFLTSDSGLHGAAGAGLRSRLSRSFPLDFSVDVTANSDRDSLNYAYVGQSF